MLKSKIVFALFATSLLLATACHHNDTMSPTCYPGQVTSETRYPSGQTTTSITTYSYDDKMNLVEIQDDGGELTFTYTNGKITSAQSTASQVIETWSYNNNGLLIHADANALPGAFITYTYTKDYSYNNAGDLTAITWNYTKPSTYTLEQNFVSTNGNLSQEVVVQDGHDVVDSIAFSAYDSKRNSSTAVAMALGNQKFYFPITILGVLPVSKNNPTIQYYSGKNTISHEYNAGGYPIKTIVTDESGNITTLTTTYTNCQ